MDIKKAKMQYNDQRCRCRIRKDVLGNPIKFNLTFEQWAEIWIQSGVYHLRGKRIGQYCMSRKNDIGHYEVGNVYIQLNSTNRVEATKGKKRPEHSKFMTGYKYNK